MEIGVKDTLKTTAEIPVVVFIIVWCFYDDSESGAYQLRESYSKGKLDIHVLGAHEYTTAHFEIDFLCECFAKVVHLGRFLFWRRHIDNRFSMLVELLRAVFS